MLRSIKLFRYLTPIDFNRTWALSAFKDLNLNLSATEG